VFQQTAAGLGIGLRTRRYRRFNKTLVDEWTYRRPYRSNAARDRALPLWVHRYNHHRAHTALGGRHRSAA
jgi:hypothetical protein